MLSRLKYTEVGNKKKTKLRKISSSSEITSPTIAHSRRNNYEESILPFIAPHPSKYRDKFAATCEKCFQRNTVCIHYKETVLKCLLVGINPSKHAWESGLYVCV